MGDLPARPSAVPASELVAQSAMRRTVLSTNFIESILP